MHEIIAYRNPAEAYMWQHPEAILFLGLGGGASLVAFTVLNWIAERLIFKYRFKYKVFTKIIEERIALAVIVLSLVMGYGFAWWVFLV